MRSLHISYGLNANVSLKPHRFYNYRRFSTGILAGKYTLHSLQMSPGNTSASVIAVLLIYFFQKQMHKPVVLMEVCIHVTFSNLGSGF